MALVSSSLCNEILLSLKDVKKLGIISEDFPCLPVRLTQTDDGFETLINGIYEDFKDVISDTLNENPMDGLDNDNSFEGRGHSH